jgi:hypothetical protein
MGSQVTIEQATGREIAHGTGYIPLQCTGLNQVFSVAILADPSGPPFRNGPALVSASVNACNYGMVFTCASATANTTVKLR